MGTTGSSVSVALAATSVPCVVADALAPEWPELATCPTLSPAAWSTLWAHPARDAEMTTALVDRPLTVEQLDTVLASERRAGPLRAALRANRLTDEQWAKLASRPPSGALSAEILTDASCPDRFRERFASVASVPSRIWPTAGATGLTVVERVEALAALSPMPGAGWHAYHDAWRAVVAVFPEALPVICTGRFPKEAATAAAGALGLLDPDLQLELVSRYGKGPDAKYIVGALAANPATATSTVEVLAAAGDPLARLRLRTPARPTLTGPAVEASDPALLARLVERSVPTQFEPHRFRPWFAVVLSANPHLDDEHRAELAEVLTTYAAQWRSAAPGPLGDAFAAAADRLGVPGTTLAPSGRWIGSKAAAEDDAVPVVDPSRIRAVALLSTWERDAAAAALAPLLGDDPDVWRAALSVAVDFPGTLSELAGVAAALAA